MHRTLLTSDAVLPLTCTRSGTCCHGKEVWINPWELARLARARAMTPRAFRDRFTCDGGIRLAFDGTPGWRGAAACSQYRGSDGCSVHADRPLACRLYPLGRERRGDTVAYIHEGNQFPCLDGCPDVVKLPRLTVKDYLGSQDVGEGEQAQDAYLEFVQDLAEGAFVLVIDGGLARSNVPVLEHWHNMAVMTPSARASSLPDDLRDLLVVPPVAAGTAADFISAHRAALDPAVQRACASLTDAAALLAASMTMLGLALHLAQSLGADTAELARHWSGTAQRNGVTR
jgi:uncharacterized protein